MKTASIAIVGAGISGLYAAWRLQQRGMDDWLLIESRETLGGRILSVAPPGSGEDDQQPSKTDRFDLGPSWFWPGYQQQLDRLVRELGLERFEQQESGDMMVERSLQTAPMRVPGYVNSPPSMRLQGGMAALVEALRQRIDGRRIMTGHSLRRLRCTGARIELDCEGDKGHRISCSAVRVWLAMPPRLVVEQIEFAPALPASLSQDWQATPTWMAPHAKYVALYDQPFWREQGLSGEARSACGPLGEIHDASLPGGSAALFGFLGIPARMRMAMAEDILRAQCRAQLARLFGPRAATPRAELFKDWALDRHTASVADRDSTGQHPVAPATGTLSGPWAGRLTGIGSEWSQRFPGYVAGAIDAVTHGLDSLPAISTSGPRQASAFTA